MYFFIFRDIGAVFKIILIFSLFFGGAKPSAAQNFSVVDQENSQETLLSKYTSARAVCARMTDPDALFQRGMLLIEDQNEEAYLAAADCFMAAAMRNHTPSQMQLGRLYEKGNGLRPSDVFAYKWYQTAVLLGNKEAVPFRNAIENRMSVDEIQATIPLIQGTLDILEMFSNREMEDIVRKETELEMLYSEKFGISLLEFDPPSESQTIIQGNPLVEAMIREQLAKEGKLKEEEAKSKKAAAPPQQQQQRPAAAAPARNAQPAGQQRRTTRRQEEEEAQKKARANDPLMMAP